MLAFFKQTQHAGKDAVKDCRINKELRVPEIEHVYSGDNGKDHTADGRPFQKHNACEHEKRKD